MGALEIVGGILLIIASILITVVVLLQESKQSGLSALGTQSDSYFSKNKGKTLEAKLVMFTRIFAVIFLLATVAMNLIVAYVK